MFLRNVAGVSGAGLALTAFSAHGPSHASVPARNPLENGKVPMSAYPYKLPDLPYAADALAPVIDTETMGLHHGKHHQAYIDKLNGALKDHSAAQQLSLTELMAKVQEMPEAVRGVIRNNGGGHVNHSMFWQVMGPPKDGAKPGGELAKAVDAAFGSLDDLKKKFNDAGVKQFGSGWVFVTVEAGGKLAVTARPNQDTPLMEGTSVLFGNDVWEHAYYLTYRNRRPEYLEAWWKVLDWPKVEARYAQLKQGETIL
ncbi:MAG: superoxide dismutase [Alphaproteobacteria bacterium]|nr:superoxide dismutase [Alphaproteobacteria bacterium]